MAFGETVSTTDAIRDIIGSYPLSVGIFREFLQNSEDAKATKQVFILDSRRHPHKSIYHPHLASMQGPALLAYNDAPFKEEDWKAIRTIHRSSKTSDTSKIGKYGIGFRACYHITDGPQILSGSTLAMLDPLCDFSDHGGEQVNLVQDTHYTDHLATFSLGDPSLPHVQIGQPFPGSIIRLPLRTNPSAIRSKGVTPEDIKQLLSDFVTEEIHISMLFLKNVQTIEVYEINEFGRCQCLARSTSSTQPPSHADAGISTFKCSMNTIVQAQQITSDWRILEASFSPLFESRLANKFDPDTQVILQRNKLQPHMSMAIPLSIITGENYIDTGRLFTFLPLPFHTRFPVHIHGLFALTRSRDKLRNREEIGLLPGSEDSILVEWNQFLFSQCLPVVWLLLLKTLKEEGITNIFRAWPPSQMPGQLGDSGYWEKLPLDIVRSLGSSMSAIPGDVWPVIASQADTAIDYQDLQNLFVAVHNESGVILEALATLGLKITRPPSYISRLLHDHPEIGAKILTPKITREYLLKPTSISKLYSNPGIESIPTVLEYLLSDGTLDNIIDLPLILQNDGRRVALKSVLSSPMTHTMLEEEEFNRFHKLDPEAIVLHQLKPHSLAKLLKQHGPTSFNVQKLTSETVAKYIHTFLQNSPHSVSTVANSDSLVISWISDFWIWSASWIHREALRIKIQAEGLALLPTSNGLKPLYCPAFDRVGMHPKMVQCLRALGVSFLHIDFPEKSRKAVQTFRNFDNINDLQTFLDILLSSHIGAFDIDMVLFLLKHLSFCVSVHISSCHSQSCILKSHLEDEKRRRLCRLPIFPLAQLKSTISASISSIPDGDKIAGISTDLLPVLPIIPGTTFLDASAIDFSLLKFLDPSAHAHRTSDLDVLSLTVDHFEIQNQAAQFALVDFMAQRRSTLPPKLLKTLGSARFVAVANEMVERPSSLVDPSSFIAPLFVGTKFLPRKSNRQEEKLVKNLVSLDVMQSTLTINLVNERIRHISSCPSDVTSHEMSKKLLEIMDEHRFDCSLMVNTLELRLAWLPTRSGLLLNSTRCRHEPDYSRTELFDHVLLPLDSNVRIPKSLRCIFGWDSPIAISVLIDQLSLILRNKDEGRAHRTTRKIFKEILGRDVGEAQSLLQTAISTKRMAPKWVPTSDGLLVDPTWAVFSDEDPDLGFHKISFSGSNAERLFLHLGCAQSPSPNIILSRLKALSRETPTHATAMKALRLLRLLPDMATFENSSQVLVPDTQYKLGLLSDIDYNDLGNKVCLIDPNPTVRIACRDLDESLATKLGMNRLGIKFASLKIPSRDLGERPLVTIRNKLREYTERQFLPEFFANAADAKATVFGVLIDECIAPSKEILHAKMARFQTCSSLIIYNNATFTEDDFAGICDTGFGGKQGRTDSIGQFGLGALTMFHFTDLSMIISGSKIAFLDPSKRNLPLPERTLVLSLDLINKFYPEQLSVLNGLFGFDSSKANYEGTIFRLPLRERLHSVEDHVVDKFWTPHEIWEQIIRPFESSAHEFLLFTKVQSILIQRRYSDCTRNEKSFHAVRKDDIEFHDDMYSYRSEIVSIGPRRSWRIVLATLMESNYPDFFNTLTPNYRLRSPIVLGIAARLQKLHKDNKVFCTIPLPFASTLPVHITAPFILSSDRRQIRLDLLDNKGSKYNRWLLEDVLPHLYVVLLSEMLHQDEADASYYQWPGNIEQNDGLTPGLVSTFYEKHLGNTSRAIFRSHYTQRSLLPTEAIILQPELPDGVIKLFSISKPDRVILLPPKVCERVVAGGAVRVVDPAFLKTEILRCVDVVQHMTLSEQKQLLAFVARDNIKEVIGLPLLSLSDGSYATFEDIAGCTKVYYLWKPSSSNTGNLFRPDRLVDSISLPRKFLNVELNIVELKGSDIKGLLLDVLQEVDERNDLCQADEELIATFWAEYPGFKSDATLIDAISSFPLVPTMQPGRYVSLSRCHDPCAVILSDRREPDSLWNELTELGLSVVATHDYDFPAPLVQILSKKSGNFPGFTFQGLLSALNSKDSSFLQLFASLSMISRQSFAQWARSKIYPSAVRDVIGLAKKLPIWPSILADSTSPFLDATNIIMLPPDVTRDMVLCFSRSIAAVEYDRTLEHLDVDSITFPELFRRLQLDRIGHLISVDDLPIYYRLLSMRLNVDKGIVPIPNSNRVLCNSDTLFARDPLFLAAFGLGSGNFVADAIVDLETKLARFGLKREATLTRDDLQKCALAIQNSEILESIEDKKTRAATVFNAFCNMLASNHGIWNESMTSIRFVPRNDIRRTTMEHLPMILSFAKELPPIVALSEICLPQFEALLWTQRGLLSQPSAIFSADGRFGHPTTPEVVRHLRVLALQVSKTYPGSPSVLSDIRETYKWLNEQADAAGPLLMQHNTDRLFLNVTEQDGDEWVWYSAQDLLLGIQNQWSNYQPIKSFLAPFETLLAKSGINRISPARWSAPAYTEDNSSSILSQFDGMRKHEKLTDVVFLAKDENQQVQKLAAHRTLLATRSDYFKDIFTGDFVESKLASAEHPIQVKMDDFSSDCVLAVLDYIYTDIIRVDIEPDEVSNKTCEYLLQMLELSDYWQMTRLHQAVQSMLCSQITLDNVRDIQARAEPVKGDHIVDVCGHYITENWNIIRIHEQRAGRDHESATPPIV